MFIHEKKYHNYSLFIVLILILSNCASGAQFENMVTTKDDGKAKFNVKFKNSISLESVSGGQETNPVWTSEVSDESFKQALVESLKSYGYYNPDNPKYNLNVTLLHLSQPIIGFDMDVNSSARYTLSKISNNSEVMNKVISNEYTVTMSDTFLGIKPLRLANEGSIKGNIYKFLNELAKK